MLSPEIINRLETLVQQLAEREGCLLYDLEFVGTGGNRVLRIYIDKKDQTAGIDDCATISRGLNEVLDTEDIIPGGAYHLEVSTPGVDRVLTKPWHFMNAIGKKASFKLNQPLASYGVQNPKLKNYKQFKEVVSEASETEIKLNIEGEEISLPYAAIDKSRIVFELEKGEKKSSDKKGRS